jgi:hypothetical protein
MAMVGLLAGGATVALSASHRTPERPSTTTNVAPRDTSKHADDQQEETNTGRPSVTGLENAIAHVSANEKAHPNAGLANALTRLQANLARHSEKGRPGHSGH